MATAAGKPNFVEKFSLQGHRLSVSSVKFSKKRGRLLASSCKQTHWRFYLPFVFTPFPCFHSTACLPAYTRRPTLNFVLLSYFGSQRIYLPACLCVCMPVFHVFVSHLLGCLTLVPVNKYTWDSSFIDHGVPYVLKRRSFSLPGCPAFQSKLFVWPCAVRTLQQQIKRFASGTHTLEFAWTSSWAIHGCVCFVDSLLRGTQSLHILGSRLFNLT